jgi:hypothetical protein
MKPHLTLVLLACSLARVHADDAKPATSNVPRAEYPLSTPTAG